MIRNVLFDLDNTLIDSNVHHEQAYRKALRDHRPQALDCFDFAAIGGITTREVMAALGVPDEQLDGVVRAKQQNYRESVAATGLEPFPRALELLTWLRQTGRRIFLVTGASRVSVDKVLVRCGIAEFFEGVVTAEDTAQGKPHPAPYLLCVERYGLDPAECLVVEDSPNGAASGRAAGLAVAVVHNPLLDPTYADLDALLRRLKGAPG